MLKFFSFKFVLGELQKVFVRFPITFICALLITISANFIIWNTNTANTLLFAKIIISCYIGLCYSLAVYLFFESKKDSKNNRIIKNVIALLIPLIFGITVYFKPDIWTKNEVQKNLILLLSGHLAVSFSAYLGKGNLNSFWEFNKSLFLRFITASVYTLVIYAGISVALLACDGLFGIDVDGKTYATLFFWCNTFFQACVFLAGITKKANLFEEKINYPNPLKVFAQYILLPIAILYLVILYAYKIKILINYSLPEGWVCTLVLAYAIVGLFCFLLLYPIKDNEDNKWVKTTLKYFYLSIIPLLVLLFISIFYRINQYGLTEIRYYVLALSFWLAGITFYGLFSKNLNIKLIPISLAALHLLMVIGPINGFTISRISQQNRLENLLIKNKIFDGTKLTITNTKMDDKEANLIQSSVSYLIKRHKLEDINPLCGIDLLKIQAYYKLNSNYSKEGTQIILDSVLNYLNIEIAIEANAEKNIYFSAKPEDICFTNGAKFLINRNNEPYNYEKEYLLEKDKLISYHTQNIDTIWIFYQNKTYLVNTEKLKNDLITFYKNTQLNEFNYLKNYLIPLKNGDGKIELILKSITLKKINEKYNFENIEYYILVK